MPSRHPARLLARRNTRRNLEAQRASLQHALEAAEAASTEDFPALVAALAERTRSLFEAAGHVARTGLAVPRGDVAHGEKLHGRALHDACSAVDGAARALAESTHTRPFTGRYADFVRAVSTLVETTEQALRSGVEGSGAPEPDAHWDAFQRMTA